MIFKLFFNITCLEIRINCILLENRGTQDMINTYQCYYKHICYYLSIINKTTCNYYLKLRYPFPAEQRNSENKKELLSNDVKYEIEVGWKFHYHYSHLSLDQCFTIHQSNAFHMLFFILLVIRLIHLKLMLLELSKQGWSDQCS